MSKLHPTERTSSPMASHQMHPTSPSRSAPEHQQPQPHVQEVTTTSTPTTASRICGWLFAPILQFLAMDRRPTRFPPKPRLKLGRHANEANNNPSNKSSASAQPVEEQSKKPDPKDDLVERDADGNYIICAGDPSIIPDKIPEIEVWSDSDADPEPVTGTVVSPIFIIF